MTTTGTLEKKFGPHKGNPHKLEGFVRDDMYRLFAELGFTTGVEIGVEKGKNAQTMFEIIPNLKLYGVDAYKHHPQASHMYHANLRNWDDKWFADCKKQCLNRMKGRNFTLLQGFSERIANKLEDNSVDFVYLDADHSYDMVMIDIILWGRKLKKGGILSGHDYVEDRDNKGRRAKVRQAIDDYTKIHGIQFYVTGENHRDRLTRDYYPSWFWVKLDDIWPNIIRK